MYDIYYAHHQYKYKYKSIKEAYELGMIRRYFPHAKIFNPSTDLKSNLLGDETIIMRECLETVRASDILIFSSIDGFVGTGVYHEVEEAQRANKIVFYIFHDQLYSDFIILERPKSQQTDRLYGTVHLNVL